MQRRPVWTLEHPEVKLDHRHQRKPPGRRCCPGDNAALKRDEPCAGEAESGDDDDLSFGAAMRRSRFAEAAEGRAEEG